MIRVAPKLVEYVAIFAVVFWLSMQIAGMSLEANISESYADFYGYLALQGLALTLAMGAFGLWYFTYDPLGLSKVSKLLIVGVWTAMIAFVTLGGIQIVPVPKASIETFQLTKETELYTATIIPGILEDLNYLAGLPMIIGLAIFLFLQRLGVEIGRSAFLGIGIVACLIAASGYNIWVVPGFTSAHVPSYGGSQMAYFGAWFFGFGQALVYFITGIFLPLAHILHNFLIVYGQLYSVVIV